MSFFSLFKNDSIATTGYFPVTTDIHSHILPGIDDGSPDLETSIELVRGLMALGVNKSIATPHVISDLYRNTPETITTSLQILQQGLKEASLNFEVAAAAEYMMDSSFFEKLERGEKLLAIKHNIILTEFAFGYQPENPQQMGFNIITNGYTPILAHPERYAYFFHNNFKAYHMLTDIGFVLQVNLLSLTGYYGTAVAKAARYILKNNLATHLGTDMHHARHLAALQDRKNQKIFEELLAHTKWNSYFDAA